jgi:hypothetical protein
MLGVRANEVSEKILECGTSRITSKVQPLQIVKIAIDTKRFKFETHFHSHSYSTVEVGVWERYVLRDKTQGGTL